MSSINDLDFTGDESLDLNYEDVPEQFAAPSGPLYPGDGYVFQLPSDLSELWGSFEWERDGKKHKDLGLNLNRDNPLIVTKSPNGRAGSGAGDSTSVYINSIPRKRGRQGIPVSDLTYLQLAIAPDEAPKKKSDLAKTITKHAGGKFMAEVQWQGQCRDDKDAPDASFWVPDADNPNGGQWEPNEKGEKGCGKKFWHSYFKDISAAQGGEYTWHNVACDDCGARIFPKVQLNRIRGVEK